MKTLAKSPSEICQLFARYMREGDLNALLTVYDPEIVFVNQAGEFRKGHDELKQELAPFVAVKAIFEFTTTRIIVSGDTALMHTDWKIWAPHETSVRAVEVARRQPDSGWRWLIGDPFTVGARLGRPVGHPVEPARAL
jgi:ketosteroid isomerase-like protein